MFDAPTTLGALLKRHRLSKDLSRAELARRTGLNANTIAKYEKAGQDGGQYPSMPKLATLAAFFDLDGRRILALCSEKKENTIKLLDAVDPEIAQGEQNKAGLAILGTTLLIAMLSSKQENPTAVNDVMSNMKELNPTLADIEKMAALMKSNLIENEMSSEDDLPSPPSPEVDET